MRTAEVILQEIRALEAQLGAVEYQRRVCEAQAAATAQRLLELNREHAIVKAATEGK